MAKECCSEVMEALYHDQGYAWMFAYEYAQSKFFFMTETEPEADLLREAIITIRPALVAVPLEEPACTPDRPEHE